MPPLHLSTILAYTPSTLLSQITRLSSRYGGKGHTFLFALSSNFALADDLQTVVNGLTTFNQNGQKATGKGESKGHTIGCLVDLFSSTQFPKSSSPVTSAGSRDLLSCSVGIFESGTCVPFRSELLGRTQPQVGRWHAFRKKEDAGVAESSGGLVAEGWEPDWSSMDARPATGNTESGMDWEDIWSRSSTKTSASSSNLDLLPEALHSIDPEQIQTLVTLSSPHPDTLTNVLSESLPEASALTLIAAPTHFITGRAVTLFLDGQIYGEGAIGLALLKDTSEACAVSYRTEILGVKHLSGPMVITNREGNMINELDSSNPTKLLISAIDLAGISPSSHISSAASSTTYFKDDEQFALGVLTPDGQISRTYKITAGDPSSRGGSLSLDAPVAPAVGTIVQFLHIPSNLPIEIPTALLPSSTSPNTAHAKQIIFVTVPEPSSSHSDSSTTLNSSFRILEDTFIVPSTRGFVFSSGLDSSPVGPSNGETAPKETRLSSNKKSAMWTCSLPGGSVVFEWTNTHNDNV